MDMLSSSNFRQYGDRDGGCEPVSWSDFVPAFLDPDYEQQLQEVVHIERGRRGSPQTLRASVVPSGRVVVVVVRSTTCPP